MMTSFVPTVVFKDVGLPGFNSIARSRGLPSLSMSTPQPKPSIPRRSFLKQAALLTGIVLVSHTSESYAKEITNEELASILVPVLNLRESLDQLRADIEQGTNADVRRVVRTLQKGFDLNSAVRQSASTLKTAADRDQARLYGREAMEYMNQVIDYYDPTSKGKPDTQVLVFAVKAVEQARVELDMLIQLYPPNIVEASRNLLNANNGSS